MGRGGSAGEPRLRVSGSPKQNAFFFALYDAKDDMHTTISQFFATILRNASNVWENKAVITSAHAVSIIIFCSLYYGFCSFYHHF